MKKVWSDPKLIVLARHNPEEAVLMTCKTGTTTMTGAQTSAQHNSSRYCISSGPPCPTCSATATS
jgi:hypothetical protein